MTAIFAWIGPDGHQGVVVADDLEADSGMKADKIRALPGGRFFVAIYGTETTSMAIDLIWALASSVTQSPFRSPEEVSSCVHRCLRAICESNYPSFVRGLPPKELASIVESSEAHMVIVDAETLDIAEVDFGPSYPPHRLFAEPKMRPLSRGRIHLFALARVVCARTSIPVERADGVRGQIDDLLVKANTSDPKSVGREGAVLEITPTSVTLKSCLTEAAGIHARYPPPEVDGRAQTRREDLEEC